MQSIAEQIHQADNQLYTHNMRKLIEGMGERERLEFFGYLNSTGALDIAKEIFGIDTFGLKNGVQDIYLLPQAQLYVGIQRETGGIEMDTLSRKEIEFLLQAFFKNETDRNYIIDLIFMHNKFLTRTQGDTIDYLARFEELFQKIGNPNKKILKIVGDTNFLDGENASNDDLFFSSPKRIEDMEIGVSQYIDQMNTIRIEYVESVFCEVIRDLANESQNHMWALDPEHMKLNIPPRLQDKITLIRSICEFHKMINPDFPMLHELIESTLASWILVYRGFSAPTYSVRHTLGENR